jgi:hypothetical protein
VGFNPYRQRVRRSSDIAIVVAALVVVTLLVLWAAFGQ